MTKKRYNSYTPAMMALTKLEIARTMAKNPEFKKKMEDRMEELKKRNASTEEKI